MSYATVEDVQSGIIRILSEREREVCETLLERAAVLIDTFNADADPVNKNSVSCSVVSRAIGDGESNIPIGATQGSMSALSYSQSWTMSGGSVGELYLTKTEKRLLGYGNKIGSHSPLEDIVYDPRCDNTTG